MCSKSLSDRLKRIKGPLRGDSVYLYVVRTIHRKHEEGMQHVIVCIRFLLGHLPGQETLEMRCGEASY